MSARSPSAPELTALAEIRRLHRVEWLKDQRARERESERRKRRRDSMTPSEYAAYLAKRRAERNKKGSWDGVGTRIANGPP